MMWIIQQEWNRWDLDLIQKHAANNINFGSRKEDIYRRITEYVKNFDKKNNVDWASGKKKWREFESKGGFRQNIGFWFFSPK